MLKKWSLLKFSEFLFSLLQGTIWLLIVGSGFCEAWRIRMGVGPRNWAGDTLKWPAAEIQEWHGVDYSGVI